MRIAILCSILFGISLFFPNPVSSALAQESPKTSKDQKNEKESKEKNKKNDVGKGVNFYSLEKEMQLGQALAKEVEKEAKFIEDEIIAEYVNRVGQNIVRNSDAKVPFKIRVIDSDVVNAFALPGGFLFVNAGLVLKTENEAELAGVMAHEIAHVAARHGTRQATRGQIVDLATLPLIFMGGWIGYGVRQAASVAIPMTFLKFSREFEAEADLLGLWYMYQAGYDPEALVDFFERLQSLEKKKPGTMEKIFASHPPNKDRIKETQRNIQNLPARPEYVTTTSEFDEVKGRLRSIFERKRGQEEKKGPTLKRKVKGKIEPTDPNKDQKDDEDERPTLKRKQ